MTSAGPESTFVVAIDGPAASGKSTTARLVAERLGFLYLDTGAMYRAVTWSVLERGLDPDDADAVEALVDGLHLEVVSDGTGGRFRVQGEDVTDRLRAPRISRSVSRVSRHPSVRRAMVRIQRELARDRRVVVEGRDIGTVVFPEASVKIYLAASLEERAERRRRELRDAGVEQSRTELISEIRARDEIDSGREDSPLRQAPDAVLLDTTGLTIEEQVAEVVRVVRGALARS
jgi:cytidylate kinase